MAKGMDGRQLARPHQEQDMRAHTHTRFRRMTVGVNGLTVGTSSRWGDEKVGLAGQGRENYVV